MGLGGAKLDDDAAAARATGAAGQGRKAGAASRKKGEDKKSTRRGNNKVFQHSPRDKTRAQAKCSVHSEGTGKRHEVNFLTCVPVPSLSNPT